MFLRAQVPEGQHGNAHYDHEHLGASKSKPADPVLLWPQPAARGCSPDPAIWPTRGPPLVALAFLHDHGRGPHHRDGEAHAVPLQAVWRNREDQEVNCVLQPNLCWFGGGQMEWTGIFPNSTALLWSLQNVFWRRYSWNNWLASYRRQTKRKWLFTNVLNVVLGHVNRCIGSCRGLRFYKLNW